MPPLGVASDLMSRRVALTTPAVTDGLRVVEQEAERIADRDRPLAHDQLVAVAERRDRQLASPSILSTARS